MIFGKNRKRDTIDCGRDAFDYMISGVRHLKHSILQHTQLFPIKICAIHLTTPPGVHPGKNVSHSLCGIHRYGSCQKSFEQKRYAQKSAGSNSTTPLSINPSSIPKQKSAFIRALIRGNLREPLPPHLLLGHNTLPR
jgi:hypothetical protein